jgi:4-hydroxybenzoate polyprenyltransferase
LILIPAWSFFLIGAAQGPWAGGGLASLRLFELVSLTSIFIVAYLINQIFDRESDEKNNKCFYLWRGIFSVRTLVVLALVFFFVASFTYRKTDGIEQMLLLALLVLSLLYSLPPARLCARPIVDMFANAIAYGGLSFLLGHGINNEGWVVAVLRASPFVLLVAATFLHTAVLDRPGDEATGKISTAVYIGDKASINLAIILHALAVGAAFVASSTPAVVVTLATFPLAGYTVLYRMPSASSLYIQGNTLVVTVAAIVLWPLYAIVVVPLIALSRFYHRRRFGLTYPGRQKAA